MKLLHIDSSALAASSVSRQLTERITAQWCATHPATMVDYLDLANNAPNHLNLDSLGFKLGTTATTDIARAENAISEKLVTQFLSADVIVVGAPMYNFSIPTQLKAWIDRIAQAGRTFTYTDKGPQGLAGGKTIIVASSRGGVYSTSVAASAMDHQEAYLKTVFGFFGVTDVRFVRAEGLAMGEAAKAQALAAAELEIKAVATNATDGAANSPQAALAA